MLAIPYRISKTAYRIFVALSPHGIERIVSYDPAQLVLPYLGDQWADLKLDCVLIGYATDEDAKKVAELCMKKDVVGALNYLSRGFKIEPTDSNEKYKAFSEVKAIDLTNTE